MRINIVAMGMGTLDTLTEEARAAICASDMLYGAKRLLETSRELCDAKTMESSSPQAIVDDIATLPLGITVSVLVSGDVGFYSLAPLVLSKLEGIVDAKDVHVYPGLSSVVYFCAKLKLPWQDVYCASAHGRALNVVGKVQSHAKTFLLTGGDTHVAALCELLVQGGLPDVQVHVGENLGYENERIVSGTAQELADESFESLSVMLVLNDHPLACTSTAASIPDEAFIRGEVPMTKHEVRTVCLDCLRIEPSHVVWDVGAGTGSVSIAASRLAYEGSVYAIERNAKGVELIRQNKELFGATNLHIVEGLAPEALHGLPKPDCVFVGGSGGNLDEIFDVVFAANPAARIVVAAITLETVSATLELFDRLGLADVDIVQVSVAKAKKAGASTLMIGGNPIYLMSANGVQE